MSALPASRRSSETPPSRIFLWLLRLLLFKLMFSSGCVKLASGDPHWRNLTALVFHYQTQPLPTWIAWYASQSSLWFLKLSCAVMFVIELGAPFLIFAPRRIRFAGAGAIVFLQVLISLTGNYTFFNWLTVALCVLLLDDFVIQRFLPAKFRVHFDRPTVAPTRQIPWFRVIPFSFAVVYVSLSIFQIVNIFGLRTDLFRPIAAVGEWIAPFRTVNDYGLFAVMTTERHEIVVEGSNDGVHWLAYEFKYKPGDMDRRPQFVAPYQPRLDWQMWFAALGDYRQNPWFVNFCVRLLQGSPPVLGLIAKNPFPDHPPLYIRAELYDYRFATPTGHRATGAWWERKWIGEYLPPGSLAGAPAF